ncbi:MAG: penicillin-binding protein 2 [Methyloprofundus sp.]|nr:penicillin-binding protein 2 [Methyloprofundus sp.]
MLALIVRAVHLQIFDIEFLQKQARDRHISKVKISAYRGQIKDKNGESLAVSAPVESIWVNPQYCSFSKEEKETRASKKIKENCASLDRATKRKVAQILGIANKKVERAFNVNSKRKFFYLKRRATPDVTKKIRALNLPGVGFIREFKRFYPAGEVTSHLLGFTNIDDRGQEGLELMYDSQLNGVSGSKLVIRDGKRRVIEEQNIESIKEPEAGQDIELSIDQRLQYLAYRELKAGVSRHKAKSASLVILEAKTGNVLAVVNQPSFNPNTRRHLTIDRYRNRAITDVFEPGSTMKPLVAAAALDGGFIKRRQLYSTKDYQIGRNWVRDGHKYGILSLSNVLKKSSNVAASKIALSMPADYFWRFYHDLGFGVSTAVGFPGEASGVLPEYDGWSKFEQATLSFGYRLSMSVLQLARSYTVLADDGMLHSVSLLKREKDEYAVRVLSAKTAKSVRKMIEKVVHKDGTAYQARIDGYRVAGKTGTVKKASKGGYGSEYLSIFVGMAPASNPELVIAVLVDSPQAGQYYGGQVAAPIFSKVMAGALRVLNVEPDEERTMSVLLKK